MTCADDRAKDWRCRKCFRRCDHMSARSGRPKYLYVALDHRIVGLFHAQSRGL